MKLKMFLLTGLLAFGYALGASAGAVTDTDTDLVPDQFDNCKNFANGPNQASNQVDTDIDGYGNACDADLDNVAGSTTFVVGGSDFAVFVSHFGLSTTAARESDFTGDGLIGGSDFSRFVQLFGLSLATNSGLACAGTIPCTP